MKRSHRVPLLVIGTLAVLTGCEKTEDLKQDYYTSHEDCQRDWGTDLQSCTPSGQGQSGYASHGGGGGYWGPRYYWDRSLGHPVAVSPSGETRVMRNSYLSRGAPSAGSSIRAGSFSHGGSSSRGGFGLSSFHFSGGG